MMTTEVQARLLDDAELAAIDAYFRAANYLTVGQIDLRDDGLLREPLQAEHIKPRLLGHWGTSPGVNLIDAHLNRLIRRHDAEVLLAVGPGHGGPAIGRSSDEDIGHLLRGHGYDAYFVEGTEPAKVHQAFAATLERAYLQIRSNQTSARQTGVVENPRWPVIVLRTPKGWTGPAVVRDFFWLYGSAT